MTEHGKKTLLKFHDIVDHEDSTISVQELRNLIDEMRSDCLDELYRDTTPNWRYYKGEENAFYIVLQLLDHLEV